MKNNDCDCDGDEGAARPTAVVLGFALTLFVCLIWACLMVWVWAPDASSYFTMEPASVSYSALWTAICSVACLVAWFVSLGEIARHDGRGET